MSLDQPALFERLGLSRADLNGEQAVDSPIDGRLLARVARHDLCEVERTLERALRCFSTLRRIPAPRRGELIRRFGQALRVHKRDLGSLISLEAGKIAQEAQGEVQEMIDICDFAVGLSRQLYGLTIASERPDHRMFETWQPLGPVAVISAFNFPTAVWAWNFAIAVVCGDPVVWKPSEKTPLSALSCQRIFESVAHELDDLPGDISQLLLGGAELGEALAREHRVALLSATGSCRMGRAVAPQVAQRLGRCLLELGGNNAMIVCPTADLRLASSAIVFSAVGTAGQRCTSLRRLIVHDDIYDALMARLHASYEQVRVGSPLEPATLVGPLIDRAAFERMQRALSEAQQQGGLVTGGERLLADRYPNAYYVRPARVEMPGQTPIVLEETFAPILYVLRYRSFDAAIALHNAAEQGLSSSVFTNDLREAERFLSASGSDCGIVNVNVGPSGAEIGGAFGGEKATGGGREAGSDCWKTYMRRVTSTLNYSSEMPLAQGIRFE